MGLGLPTDLHRFSRIFNFSTRAGNYLDDGNEEKYVEFLAKAAMSDLKCSTMENMALQSLAVRLFQNGEEHIERAERYITSLKSHAFFHRL